jgi:endonuclease/exonuclease/phosphatase family metal-dependent hydrolase
MEVIFLNTWNGKIREGISAFIKRQAPDTDVFCFQEVYEEMRTLLGELLPNYRMISGYKKVAEDDDFSQATFVRSDLELLSSEFVLENQPGAGLAIYTQINMQNTAIHLCNLHGTARPGSKLDTPQRIAQSQELLDFFEEKKGMKILGGDFNLRPETKSAQMFEENGYRSLIKEFRIRTTRNRLSWELYPENKQYFSDYIFVSPDVNVREFSVPTNEISDHLPLVLKIE